MTERRGEIKWNRAEPLTPRSPVNVKVSGIKSELTDDLTRHQRVEKQRLQNALHVHGGQ